ncbi:hypothetical protein ECANGB1_1107 [Enterospora canceri]|uniref:Amino acid transporter transmembrane domain-containing protein n=1 Tax=Enterospora canceri TaxID=1081671 RepID=A0A1Y1S6R1_9MICR|nr:hypothetical protein ECANGB1_1107 [Enterospora canceri]
MTTNKKNSTMVAGLLFGTSAFGMGMLYMPATFNQLGYVGMSTIMAFMFLLTYLSLYFINLADEKEQEIEKSSSKRDYSFFANFNRHLSLMVTIAFILSNFAVVYLFLRRATDLTVALINIKAKMATTTWVRLGVLTFYSIAALSLFMQHDLTILKPLSYVALFACFYYAALMVMLGFTSKIPLSELKPFRYDNGLNALLNAIFAAHCQFSFLNFKDTLRVKNDRNSKKMLLIACLTIYLSYATIGFFGYKYMGSSIGSDYILGLVVKNFSENKLLDNNNLFGRKLFQGLLFVLSTLFIVIFFTGIPLTVFTFVPEIEKLVKRANVKPNTRIVKLIIGLALYVFALPSSLNEGLFLAFVSAFCTNFLSFGFPGIYAVHYSTDRRIRGIGYSMIGFSSILALLLAGVEIKNAVSK